jgi:hypothetical protein
MIFRQMNHVPMQPLIPQEYVRQFNQLPNHHPTFVSEDDPEFQRRTEAERLAAQSLENDYQARLTALRSILQMLLSFKFDYVRLNVGAAPSVPQD